MKAIDGKYYSTDVVDIEGMFRIIESIPSKNAEPIKQWLAKLGSERIDETFDPSLATQRTIDLYRTRGYDEKWIAKRLKGIQDRKQLTDIWKDGGITEGRESAIMFGISPILIEGVLVGRKIENDKESLNYIKSKLPDCYICNLDGKVIVGNK